MAAAIACASAISTPDPGLKNASAVNCGLSRDSLTNICDRSIGAAFDDNLLRSLSSTPSLSAASSGSVIDAELPSSTMLIIGIAGLKLGAMVGGCEEC